MDSPPYAFFALLFKHLAADSDVLVRRGYASAATTLASVNRRWRAMTLFLLSRIPPASAPEDWHRDLALKRNPLAMARVRFNAACETHRICYDMRFQGRLYAIFRCDCPDCTSPYPGYARRPGSKRTQRNCDRLARKRARLDAEMQQRTKFHDELHDLLYNEERALETRIWQAVDWFNARPAALLH
jgi:hypothetical protein